MDSETLLKAVLAKIGKKYEYVKHLGGGTYSNVYLVKHTLLGEDHALKIMDYTFIRQRLKKNPLEDIKKKFDEVKERFLIEARMYKKLAHPNIVKIYDIDFIEDMIEDIDIPYILMEYIKGSTLAAILRTEAPMEFNRGIKIAKDVLSALDIIHQNNVIHRDLKPANIMIEDCTGKAILIDLGIAKDILSGSGLTTNGALMGSPGYMAPEQFYESSTIAPVTDVYAFGVVLYEILTGELPFKGENFLKIINSKGKKFRFNISEKNPSLPRGMDEILTRSLHKDPELRYKNAGELLNALNRINESRYSQKTIYTLYATAALIVAAAVSIIIFDPFHFYGDKQRHSSGNSVISAENNTGNQPAGLKNGTDPSSNNSNNSGNLTAQAKPDGNNSSANSEEEYNNRILSAKEAIRAGDYNRAAEFIQKAEEIKLTDETKTLLDEILNKRIDLELTNGGKEFETIKNQPNLTKYIAFKTKYPNSIHLSELAKRLKSIEKNLPPEKYWNNSLKQNKKGYYEYTFGPENGNHTMIFVPEKKFWIDKYEVSNGQFRRFLREERSDFGSSSSNKFINTGEEYPATVSYKDAEKYGKKYGFRLPTVEEWEYVASAGKSTYPWGEESPDANGVWHANADSLEGDYEKDGFKGTAPITSFEKYASPFGIVNMAGNVWEWTMGSILKGGGLFSDKEDLKIKNNMHGKNNDKEGFRCIKEEKD